MARKQRQKQKAAKAAAPVPVGISSRYRFFLWLCGFFFLASLFIRLDVITIWPGAEGWALDLALSNERGAYFPAFLQNSLLAPGATLFPGADLFYLFPRILSAVCLVLTFVLFYHWGKRLFGKRVVQLQLLVLGGSLWLPFFGKMATTDSWALLGHTGLWLSTLLLVQSGDRKHRLAQLFFALLSAVAAPLSSLIFFVVMVLGFYLQRRQREILVSASLIVVVLAVVLLLQGPADRTSYYFLASGWDRYGKLLAYSILGLLPAFGFLIGGLRDLLFKLRKGEALAITLGIAALASLASQSLLLPLVLAAMAGKQMQLYFSDRYPWNDWVRGPAVLQLIFAFIAAFLGLMSGLIQFRGEGYRAVLGMVAAYWIFSLFAVIGLYGNRRDFTIGGTVLTGLLSVLFFWVQVYPYLELDRHWPQSLVESAKLPVGTTVQVPDSTHYSNALPYFRRAGWEHEADDATYVVKMFPADSTEVNADFLTNGRVFTQRRRFGLDKK